MSEYEHPARDPSDSPIAGLLFGDTPWLMLSVLLACGLITYSLTQESVLAILAVVLAGLAGLAAHESLMRRMDAVPDEEAQR